MDQQFMLGFTAGIFICIEIYLIFHTIKGKGNTKNNKRNNILRKYSSILLSISLLITAVCIFMMVYFWLFNIKPIENSDIMKNILAYTENESGKNILITIVFSFEFVLITYLSIKFKSYQGINSILPRAIMFFTLTILFLSYNSFLLFSNFKDPLSYSGISLGITSLFFTILIALLTFRSDDNTHLITKKELAQEIVDLIYNKKPLENAADEIVKLNKLLEEGILTQDEFDAKKKQLLGI